MARGSVVGSPRFEAQNLRLTNCRCDSCCHPPLYQHPYLDHPANPLCLQMEGHCHRRFRKIPAASRVSRVGCPRSCGDGSEGNVLYSKLLLQCHLRPRSILVYTRNQTDLFPTLLTVVRRCIELSHGVWAFELHFIRGKEKKIATTAKVFAFVIPFATQIAIQTPAVKRSLVSYIIVGNILCEFALMGEGAQNIILTAR